MPRKKASKKINLALQGGGAHGAFTWGALVRFLEDERIEIAGISGTSAGALNGAAVKSGLVCNGREGAIENLAFVWDKIAGVQDLRMSEWLMPIPPGAVSSALEYSPIYKFGEAWTRMVSPYAYGPFYKNPLADVVAALDYESVCSHLGPKFFVSTTRVRNGKLRVFKEDEVNGDVILASACLPTLFRAVEMYDSETEQTEAFWDGGYAGNPALFPLFDQNLPDDIVIVNINPLERTELPISPEQIQNRINEISFNSSLLRELRAINFVQRMLDDGTMQTGQMARVYVHMVSDDALMNELSVATKTVPNAYVIHALQKAGYRAADDFLTAQFDQIGEGSSVDLRDMFG